MTGSAVSSSGQRARAANLGVGIHFFTSIEQEIEWAKQGANIIMHSSDLVRVRETFTADFQRFREELGDAAGPKGGGGKEVI